MISVVLSSLAVLSFGLLVWQVIVAARFPLHGRSRVEGFAPGVTILKPLKGCDSETIACLRSWFEQDYSGPVQILFGVTSENDPVCELVRNLIAGHPKANAELVVCGRRLGPNSKVSTLAQLQVLASHDFICVSDADVRVPPDFLTSTLGTFRDASVGVVNCFYRFTTASNLPMRWEAFAINADFWSQVLQALSLRPMDFGLGAAMLLPRRQLENIGGFDQLVDHLADDYQLGNRIAQNGARIVISPIVVECRCAPMTFSEVWDHQLRWARTIRVCQGGPFFLSVLSNASLWPILWLAASPSMTSLFGASAFLAFRMVVGYALDRKLTGAGRPGSLGMAVMKDFLQVGIWFRAYTGRKVTWRGVDYRVDTAGRMMQADEGTPAPLSPA
jgi:ceramide glucosyltransferase